MRFSISCFSVRHRRLLAAILGVYACMAVSCSGPEQKEEKQEHVQNNQVASINTSASHEATQETPPKAESDPVIPKPKAVKKPKGIFRTVVRGNTSNVEQTVAFYNDYTYQLQEKYQDQGKDTVTITQGNWMPSDGYIWLYKDQIALARYLWKGDTLKYLSPVLKKEVSMHPLKDILENDTWQSKKAEGTVLYGVGNEPFWSVEVNAQDSLSFRLAEWQQPLKLKVDSFRHVKDSSFYTAQNDSVTIKITVLPYFCNDGMSDYVYKNKVKVEYNQKVLNGCGVGM